MYGIVGACILALFLTGGVIGTTAQAQSERSCPNGGICPKGTCPAFNPRTQDSGPQRACNVANCSAKNCPSKKK